MTHIRLIVDSKVVFDATLNEWQATPPEYFKDKLRPDVNPESWLKAVMIVMAEAAATSHDVEIKVNVNYPTVIGGMREWVMEVRQL